MCVFALFCLCFFCFASHVGIRIFSLRDATLAQGIRCWKSSGRCIIFTRFVFVLRTPPALVYLKSQSPKLSEIMSGSEATFNPNMVAEPRHPDSIANRIQYIQQQNQALLELQTLLNTAMDDKIENLNENVQIKITEFETVVKDDNDRIKFTVHEALKVSTIRTTKSLK